MTSQNRTSKVSERDDALFAQDVDVEALDLDASDDEDDELPMPAPIKARERFIDDKFNKSLDATQIYLNEIGFSPLLSAEEEVIALFNNIIYRMKFI